MILEPDVFIIVKLVQCHNYIFLLSSPIVRQIICFIVLQGGLAIAINDSLDPDFVNSKVPQGPQASRSNIELHEITLPVRPPHTM